MQISKKEIKISRGESNRYIEKIVLTGIILGFFSNDNEIINILHYLLFIFAQGCSILKLVISSGIKRAGTLVIKYIFTIFIILLITITFLEIGAERQPIVNRIFPLMALFGITIVVEPSTGFEIDYFLYRVTFAYSILAMVVCMDSIRFLISGTCIWLPIHYLGLRFVGPMGDPNYLALSSAVFLLVCMFSPREKIIMRKMSVTVLLGTIFLAKSISSFILIPATILLHIFIKERNALKKGLFVFGIYLLFMTVYANHVDEIEKLVVSGLNVFYRNSFYSTTKWHSLKIRFDTQLLALQIFLKEWWGQGPRQIVPQLGRDTHNSFVSILFEQGILGIILLFLPLRGKAAKNGLIDIIGNYIFLNALLLDVHFSVLYVLFLVIQYKDDEYSVRTLNIVRDNKKRYNTNII